MPKDYTGLLQESVPRSTPQLGPPLPGDLGRPILNAQGSGPSADAQRAAQEDEAARVGSLLATTNVRQGPAPAATAPTPNAGVAAVPSASEAKPPLDPNSLQNMQERKLAFANATADKRTVSADRLADSVSRYVLLAGAVIAAALITGIRSDLPDETTNTTETIPPIPKRDGSA